MLDEEWHVVASLAQRRQRHAHHVQTIEEVLAEAALLHHPAEVAVRGHQHANVDLERALAAHATKLAGLQHAQQLHLHRRRHLAHLVEEQGAARGHLEQAAALGVGAGERAAHVAEQRRLEECLGDRAARFGDERARAARPVVVDGARYQLLAGARLAVDHHRQRGVGDPVEQPEQLEHARRATHQVLVVVADGERGAALAHFFVELAELERLIGDLALELVVQIGHFPSLPFVLREQPGVLDGDRSLLGEIADQRHVGVAERARSQSMVGVDTADHAPLDRQRHRQHRAQLQIGDRQRGLEPFVAGGVERDDRRGFARGALGDAATERSLAPL